MKTLLPNTALQEKSEESVSFSPQEKEKTQSMGVGRNGLSIAWKKHAFCAYKITICKMPHLNFYNFVLFKYSQNLMAVMFVISFVKIK
jgi:hypothetical protein